MNKNNLALGSFFARSPRRRRKHPAHTPARATCHILRNEPPLECSPLHSNAGDAMPQSPGNMACMLPELCGTLVPTCCPAVGAASRHLKLAQMKRGSTNTTTCPYSTIRGKYSTTRDARKHGTNRCDHRRAICDLHIVDGGHFGMALCGRDAPFFTHGLGERMAAILAIRRARVVLALWAPPCRRQTRRFGLRRNAFCPLCGRLRCMSGLVRGASTRIGVATVAGLLPWFGGGGVVLIEFVVFRVVFAHLRQAGHG